mmetsp:Transcript_22652/g.89617  ORF Transcript_22652/g.89617 Transcript_22652/m.89617 type:complete len:266 (+) Transcript_22652:1067-1864(+)
MGIDRASERGPGQGSHEVEFALVLLGEVELHRSLELRREQVLEAGHLLVDVVAQCRSVVAGKVRPKQQQHVQRNHACPVLHPVRGDVGAQDPEAHLEELVSYARELSDAGRGFGKVRQQPVHAASHDAERTGDGLLGEDIVLAEDCPAVVQELLRVRLEESHKLLEPPKRVAERYDLLLFDRLALIEFLAELLEELDVTGKLRRHALLELDELALHNIAEYVILLEQVLERVDAAGEDGHFEAVKECRLERGDKSGEGRLFLLSE